MEAKIWKRKKKKLTGQQEKNDLTNGSMRCKRTHFLPSTLKKTENQRIRTEAKNKKNQVTEREIRTLLNFLNRSRESF